LKATIVTERKLLTVSDEKNIILFFLKLGWTLTGVSQSNLGFEMLQQKHMAKTTSTKKKPTKGKR
jgi:hypothetical protein